MISDEPHYEYQIQRAVNRENRNEDVGKSVAISFNYGMVESEKYGNASVAGSVLCFTKYENKQAILDEEDYSATTFGDVATAIIEDLQGVGGKVDLQSDENIGKMRVFEAQGSDVADWVTILYPSVPFTDKKVGILTTAVTGQIDDGFKQAVAEGKSLEPIMNAYKGALRGEYRHLDQIDYLEDVPEYLRDTVAMFILLRKEAILQSKSEETWASFERDFLDFLQAVSTEHEQSSDSVEDYLYSRDFTAAGRIAAEVTWIILGLEVPGDVRRHPDFQTLKSLQSIYSGLVNDVMALRKELEAGELNNIVLILAQTMPLQRAIEGSLRLVESIFYKARELERRLVKTFGEHKILARILHAAGRCVDCTTVSYEHYSDRYALDGSSHYAIVEFNENYMLKEREMEGILLRMRLDDLNLDSQKLEQREISDCPGGQYALKNLRPVLPLTKMPKGGVIDPKLPKHLALIPDGNRRWAKSRGLKPWKGHGVTCDASMQLLAELWDQGLHSVTIWGLSPDNFKRPKAELDYIWFECEKFAILARQVCDEYRARFCSIGNVDRIPTRVMRILNKMESETRDRTAHCVTLALDYGGIEEVLHAVQQIEGDVGNVTADTITENLYASRKNVMYPKPDLVVRTGAKDAATVRTSGFMVWQAAQAEMYFESKYMPDVTSEDVASWLVAYTQSEQRLGK